MLTRTQDGLMWWLIGVYFSPIIYIFDVKIHWALIAFCCLLVVNVSKKTWGFLWNKLIVAIAKEMNKQNDSKK
ncbi:hypothetical protein [Bacillus paramycoides]|uniref:hypothetical protein n=1 Tax=Bacillus paramycoides TaxID=2026194 RepID=UPI003D218887